MLKDIVNNYVFQNAYEAYFSDKLYQVLGVINKDCEKKEMYKTSSYTIVGSFNLKERNIDFPNIFTYAYSTYKICKNNIVDFGKLKNSDFNTMSIDFSKRKFKSNSFTKSLENKIEFIIK